MNGSEIAGLLNTNLLLSEIGYTIFQNQSLPLSNVKTTKITIDASILDIINGSITRVSSLNVHSKEFKWAPQIQIEAMPEYYAVAQSMYSKNSCIGHGVFSCFFGVPILGITMMIFAVSFLFAVASEKSNGIVGFLKVMGLMDSVYWFTWLLTLGFCGFIFSMLMAGLGKVSGAAIFVNSDFLALALVFFSVVIVLGASALAFSSLFSKPKWVRAVVFLQILFCIAFSFIFGSSMPESPNQMTNLAVIISAPSMSVILKMLTFLIPWFHFARLYVSLLNGTGLKQNEIGGKVTQSYFTLKSYTTRPKHLTLAGLASCSEFPSCCDVYDICFEIPSGLES